MSFSINLESEDGSSNVTQGGSLMQRTESFEKLTEVVDNKVMEVADDAVKAQEIAIYTKDEALALEQEIKDALNRTQGKQIF